MYACLKHPEHTHTLTHTYTYLNTYRHTQTLIQTPSVSSTCRSSHTLEPPLSAFDVSIQATPQRNEVMILGVLKWN